MKKSRSAMRRLVLLGSLLAVCLNAQAIEFVVKVQGGDKAARHVPVRVPMDGDVESQFVSLSGDGNYLLGQIEKPGLVGNTMGEGMELTFVLPQLDAGKEVEMVGKTISEEEVPNAFRLVVDTEHTREIRFGDRKILRCMHESIDRSSKERIGETYKVFHHVYDPTGEFYVTKGPGGLFPHHRGLFFGFNRISYGENGEQKADIWHCRNGERQNYARLEYGFGGPAFGREVSEIDWHGRDDKVFAKEYRELTAYNADGGTLIEFQSLLESKVGKVRLDGDPQHAGFQFRASQHVPDNTKQLTYYVRPDGKGEPGKFRNWSAKEDETEENLAHVNLPWNALSFVINDQRYTCCYLDHPNNPKEARFSERDYGRFGSYFEYDMDTNKPLKLNYRIWLQAGEMTVDEIAAIHNGFISPPSATVELQK